MLPLWGDPLSYRQSGDDGGSSRLVVLLKITLHVCGKYYSTGNRNPYQKMFWPLITCRGTLLPNPRTMPNQFINSGVTAIEAKES